MEYFFIVSGYFMIQTFEHHKTMDTWSYLKKRLKRLYPHYIFSFFVMYLAVNRLEAFKFSNIVRGIPEMLLLQDIGLFKGGFNQPLWYLSVLFTASAVLFFLLKKLPIKIYNFMAILCIVIVYGYLLHCGKIEVWGQCLIFTISWWRGTADLFIGTLIYQLADKLNQYINKYIIEIHIIEIVCTALLIMCICIKDNEMLDFVAVLCIIVLVMIMTTPYSLYKKVPDLKLIPYEYAIYLNHWFVIRLLNKIFTFMSWDSINNMIKLLILLVVTIIYSIFTTHIVERIMQIRFHS